MNHPIVQFCEDQKLRFNHSLGQNFLINDEILEKIMEAANIKPNEKVIEIGPGVGVLTEQLLLAGAEVTAVDVDERMVKLLPMYLHSQGVNLQNLEVLRRNALEVAMPSIPYKMVANIPYHITSPLFRHVFLESDTLPTSLTLLIQHEVAQKICSEKDRSMLSIIVGLFGKARYVTKVLPACFIPPPKVDSAVIHVDCYSTPLASPTIIEKVFKLTKIAFAQRRKKLSNTIGALDEGMQRMAKVGIDSSLRPQTLTVEQWIDLAQLN
jgi:16S rRNA (adenine1518-N6/adenine1519-N6)-dimethyltransferase